MSKRRIRHFVGLAFLCFSMIMACGNRLLPSEGKLDNEGSRKIDGPRIEIAMDGSQARLDWQAVDSAECQLAWGQNPACDEGMANIRPDPSNRYAFTIKSLLPGHEYYYRITGRGLFCSGAFQTGMRMENELNKAGSAHSEVPPIDVRHRLEEFVVVSRRIPEESFQSDRSVSTVDRKALDEQNPRTVPEALWEAPGVYVQHTNLGGGSPIIRGMMGPQVLITVDGVRFNNSTYRTGPGQYLNLIDPLFIEQIEVLRGPGSILYGSDAMGGVIQLTPYSQAAAGNDGHWQLNNNLYSSVNTADKGRILNGRFSAQRNGFSLTGSASYKLFGDLRGGREVGLQPFVGYDQVSGFAVSSFRISRGLLKNGLVTVGYLFNRINDAGRIDQLASNKILQVYDNTDHLAYGRLEMESPAIHSQARVTVSFQDFYEQKDEIKLANDLQTPLKTTRDQVRAGTWGADVNCLTSFTPAFQLNYGAMSYQDVVTADRMNRKAGESWLPNKDQSYPDGSRYANYGLYLLAEWQPLVLHGNQRLKINGGYRFHGISSRVPEGDGLPAVDFSFAGSIFSLGAQYAAGDATNLSLTFSQGFRAPNLQEAVMLGDTGKFFHVPNYGLRPESSDTLEVLLKSRLGRALFSFSGYVSFLRDLIKREPALWNNQSRINGVDVAANVNGGDGIVWGAEGAFIADVGKNILLSGNVTYTWGKEYVNGGADVPLTRIPPLFGQMTLRYERPMPGNGLWFAEAFVRAAGKQGRLSPEDMKDVRIPAGGTPGWWTLNLRGGLSLGKHLRLGMSLENLLNVKYKYHASGIYSPGTNLTLSFGFY